VKKSNPKVVVYILAGGSGSRLYPLSLPRAKPAVPIAGSFRQIDVPVSNCFNSGLGYVRVIVQSEPESLINHVHGYHTHVAEGRGEFINVLTSHTNTGFFASDADSIYLLRNTLVKEEFDIVIVLMADQLVKIDFRPIINKFWDSQADGLIVYHRTKLQEAKLQLGVLELAAGGKVIDLQEKPENPLPTVDDAGTCYANTAMYMFTMSSFKEMINSMEQNRRPEENLSSTGITWLIRNKDVIGHDLVSAPTDDLPLRELGYFVDTGTLDSYAKAHFDMCSRMPHFDFYNSPWNTHTVVRGLLNPSKFNDVTMSSTLVGYNVISEEKVVLQNSVISDNVRIGSGSAITNSVILPGVILRPGCSINNVVFDKDIVIPSGTQLDGSHPPINTLAHREVLEMLKNKKTVPENRPILSDGGILFFHKGYKL